MPRMFPGDGQVPQQGHLSGMTVQKNVKSICQKYQCAGVLQMQPEMLHQNRTNTEKKWYRLHHSISGMAGTKYRVFNSMWDAETKYSSASHCFLFSRYFFFCVLFVMFSSFSVSCA